MELETTTIKSPGMKLFQLMTILLAFLAKEVWMTPMGMSKYNSIIVVSQGGNDSVDCWKNSSLPCASLQFALLKPNLNNTLVLMKSGIHNVSKDIVLENVHNFSLQGESTNPANNNSVRDVAIKCVQRSIGLSFKWCYSLSFSDFEINSCGGKHLSTSRSVPDVPRKSNFSFVWTAMYFERCLHISFHRVKLSNNLGMGALMYNVGGTMYFENATFQRNMEKRYFMNATDANGFPTIFIPGLASGGGLYIEFTLRLVKDPLMAYFVSNSKWTFKNCSFVGNTAEHEYSRLSVDGRNYIAFGRGGGISIIFRGNATNNKFRIDGCRFTENVALWGAGLFLEFHDNALNNTLTVNHSHFKNNNATYGGGGIRIGTTLQRPSTGNMVTIRTSLIKGNRAKVGGGFSQYRLSNVGKKDETTHITNCIFDTNYAIMGSAIHLIFVHLHCIDNYIIGNTGCSFDDECNDMIGQGSIYSSRSELSFRGNNELRHNKHSSIVLDGSQAIIHDNLTFFNNSGLDGGAVGLYGYSTVRLTRHSRIDFINNTASKKGGAIYFYEAGPPVAPLSSTEFIMYNYSCCIVLGDHDIDDAEPDKFPARMNFVSNFAAPSSGNAIFATSVAPCRRRGDPKYNNTVLRWNIFNFSQNEEPAIVTSPIKIETDRRYWEAIPGEYFSPRVVLRDEHWNSVYGTIRVTVKQVTKGWAHISGSNLFVVKDKIIGILFTGKENARFSILLETITEVPVQYWINNLTLGSCPLGFYLTKLGKCECLASRGESNTGVTHCTGHDVYVLKGRWVNPNKSYVPGGDADFAEHICPAHYCSGDCKGRDTTDGVDCLFQKETQCAENRKWDSVLCGACNEGYSVKFGSEHCARCKYTHLLFILLLIVVLSLFVFFVLFLNIDSYPTYLNAFLYSYQVIPLINGFQLPGEHYDPFISVVVGLSGFAGSGDAKIGVCLWDGMTNIQKIAFNYFVPSYIIFFVVIIARISARLQRRELGRVMQTLRRWLFNGQASLHALAFIAVVAYSDFTRVSLMLLCPSKVRSRWVLYYAGDVAFFSGEHLDYAIPAILVTIFIVLIVPFAIILKPCTIRFFPRLQGIIDPLEYCFKREPIYRCFSGFYFVSRLSLLVTHVYTGSNALRNVILLSLSTAIAGVFSAFRPYRDNAMNIYDIILLANVSLIAGLNGFIDGVIENNIRDGLLIWAHIHVFVPLLALIYPLGRWLYQKCQERRQHALAHGRFELSFGFLSKQKRFKTVCWSTMLITDAP